MGELLAFEGTAFEKQAELKSNVAEDIPRLFERFYRSDASHSDSGHYGLGLAIAKAIVERYGGTILAESSDGETVFRVKIPLNKELTKNNL